jgi:hypothetical protein
VLLSVLPLTFVPLPVGPLEDAVAVLSVLVVGAGVDPAVLPGELAVAFTFIVSKHSFVKLAVSPLEDTVAMHFVLDPGTSVSFLIRPVVYTFARYFILVELPFIYTAVCEGESTRTIFLSV